MARMLSRNWNALTLLVTGLVFIVFATTALADDWPPPEGEARLGRRDRVCVKSNGYGGGSCTHYTVNCIPRPNDPFIATWCPGKNFLKRSQIRFFGHCQVEQLSLCDEFELYPCARLQFGTLPNCTIPGELPCFHWVHVANACPQ